MPPRKTSRPPPYAARQQSGFRLPPALRNLLRRDRLRVVVLAILGFLTLFWLLGKTGGDSDSNAPSLPKVAIGSGAPVVIVTVLDPKGDPAWVAKLKHNREDYAKRHGTSQGQCNAMQCNAIYKMWHEIDSPQATKHSSPTTTSTLSTTLR
jgi:mannan polymerase II complex MNN11 subunit